MNFEKPLIPPNTESLDGRIVKSVSVDLERGVLPVYSEERQLVGKVTKITVDGDGIVYATGELLQEAKDGALAAEIGRGMLHGVSITDTPAFDFEKDEK